MQVVVEGLRLSGLGWAGCVGARIIGTEAHEGQVHGTVGPVHHGLQFAGAEVGCEVEGDSSIRTLAEQAFVRLRARSDAHLAHFAYFFISWNIKRRNKYMKVTKVMGKI